MKDKDLRQRQNIYNINSLPDMIVVGDFNNRNIFQLGTC